MRSGYSNRNGRGGEASRGDIFEGGENRDGPERGEGRENHEHGEGRGRGEGHGRGGRHGHGGHRGERGEGRGGHGERRGGRGERGEGRGHHGGEGGRRRKRLFDAAELQLLLLSLAGEQPSHGYELIREIEARSKGGYAPSPGVVYPALTFMEEGGLLEGVQDGSRKNYRATDEGKARIAAQADDVAALQARLTSLAEVRERVDAAPVRRAMQNLRTVIFDHLSQEQVDREIVQRVAELIDDAARNIERIGL